MYENFILRLPAKSEFMFFTILRKFILIGTETNEKISSRINTASKSFKQNQYFSVFHFL